MESWHACITVRRISAIGGPTETCSQFADKGKGTALPQRCSAYSISTCVEQSLLCTILLLGKVWASVIITSGTGARLCQTSGKDGILHIIRTGTRPPWTKRLHFCRLTAEASVSADVPYRT